MTISTLSIQNSQAEAAPVIRKVLYTREHRPEEYTTDLMKYVAQEVKVNPNLMVRLAPVANAMLRGWESAATEYSTVTYKGDKPIAVQTFYRITDYSSNKLFGLMTKLLTSMGVGKEFKADDIDIAFVLLGGVLNQYGTAAGLKKDDIVKLDKFRLKNSDFLTVSEFGGNEVRITNLKTKKIETLELDEKAVAKIVQYANGFMTKIHKDKYKTITKEDPIPSELGRYRNMYKAAHILDRKKNS